MSFATGFVCLLAGYAALGALFALAFLTAGVGRVDAAARNAALSVRLLLLPGVVALWPLLLRLWVRVERGGE